MCANKKYYFLSDIHLGYPNAKESLLREKKLVDLLNTIKFDACELFLVGDIFDFWWEWKHVAPRGYTRFLGKLSEFTDLGIKVHFFIGNHDIWVFDYLPQETGIILHQEPYTPDIFGKSFYIHHGDCLGKFDRGYKLLNLYILKNRFLQWCFSRLHPNFAFKIAYTWSHHSRESHDEPAFLGEEKEWLVLYAKQVLEKQHYDYFIFGHRHFPVEIPLNNSTSYINLGDWLEHFSYGVFDGDSFHLKKYRAND